MMSGEQRLPIGEPWKSTRAWLTRISSAPTR
jgi:hypothetical protein